MGQTPGDEQKQEPSLQLPSLSLPGFGRRRKAAKRGEEPSTPESEPLDEPLDEPRDEPTAEIYPAEASDSPSRSNGDATHLIEHELPGRDPEPSATPATPAPSRRKEGKERRAPRVPGRLAAGITGLLVGAAGGAATYGALEGCEAVRGVSTCGGAPGFFILVAILALMVLLGSLILKAFRVGASGSTSFLAVGVVTVIAMLVLLDVIFSVWMFVVIPVLSALAFVLAHWVTTRFDEEPRDLRR